MRVQISPLLSGLVLLLGLGVNAFPRFPSLHPRQEHGTATKWLQASDDNVKAAYTPEKRQDNDADTNTTLSTPTVKNPVTQKTVLDIRASPYNYVESPGVPEDGWFMWIIDPESTFLGFDLDTFGYKEGVGQALVAEAYNSADPRKGNRLKLRDILLGWWKDQSGMPVSSLTSVYLQAVVEESTKAAIDKAYRLMGITDRNKSLTLYSGGDDRNMAAAFEELLTNSKFGSGMDLMLKEYSDSEFHGKAITAFQMFRASGSSITSLVIAWG